MPVVTDRGVLVFPKHTLTQHPRCSGQSPVRTAEGLIARVDPQKRIGQLIQRMLQSVVVHEGDDPPNERMALRKEHKRVMAEWTSIFKRIHQSNVTIMLDVGD